MNAPSRLSLVLPILALGLLVQSCTDTPELLIPVELQFAKGGKPGKPGDEPVAPDPILEEFWVYGTPDCPNMIHIVVSGQFLDIRKGVAHDHFFNGVRDGDAPVDTHFEFGFSGQKTPATEFNADGTAGHVDICFNGVRQVEMDDDGTVTSVAYFNDYPSTSVGGTGADPIAISLGVTSTSGESKSFRPMGVVVEGITGARHAGSVESVWHDGQRFTDVASYAVNENFGPALGQLYFSNLSISNVDCRASTTIVGKGKNKTRLSTTSVSAEVSIGYGAAGPYNQHFWGEGHLLVTPEAQPNNWFITDRIMTPGIDRTFGTGGSLDADLSGQTVTVEFAADFLHPVGGTEDWTYGPRTQRYDFVYDPGMNADGLRTTAGFVGLPWDGAYSVSKGLDDGLFPVAHSNAVTVVCR